MRLEGTEQVVVILGPFVDANLLHAHLVGGPVGLNEQTRSVHQHPLLNVLRYVSIGSVAVEELILAVVVRGAFCGLQFSR